MSQSLIFGIQVNTAGATQALNNFNNQLTNVSNGIASGFNARLAESPVGKFMDKLKLATSSSTEFGKALGGGVVVGLQAAAVAGAAAATAVTAFTVASAAAANQIKQMSDATGVSTSTISKFATMVSKGGGSVSDATDIMKDYADKLGDARKGNADLGDTFKKLGVDITQNNGVAFAQTIDGLGKMKDKSVAMNIGMQLFSDNYTKIASQIANGNTVINQNPIMSDEFIQKSEVLMSSFNRLKTNLITFGTEAVLPIIEDLNTLIGIIMKPDLKGETPLEKAMKQISASIKNASSNISFFTGGKQATETNTMTAEETLAANKRSLEMAQNAVKSAKEAYDLAVKTNSSNIASAKSNYENSLKHLAANKRSLEMYQNGVKSAKEAYDLAVKTNSYNIASAKSNYENSLKYLAATKKIVDSNQKLVDDKAQAAKDKATAQAKLIQSQKTAEADKAKAEAARAKAKADADAAEAKRLAEYNAAVAKALAIADTARKENLSTTLAGRLALIAEEEKEQIKSINAVKDKDKELDKTSALEDIKIRSARKIADETKRYNDEVAAKALVDIKEQQSAWKAYSDAYMKLVESSRISFNEGGKNLPNTYGNKALSISGKKDDENWELSRLLVKLAEERKLLEETTPQFDDRPTGSNDPDPYKASDDRKNLYEERIKSNQMYIDGVIEAISLGNNKLIGEYLRMEDALPTTIWGRIFKVTDEDEEALNRGIEMMGLSLSTAMNMFSTISETRYATEMKSAEDAKSIAQGELASKRMTDKARLSEQKKIDDQYDKAKRDAFNKTKGLKIAQVGMDTASAIMGAWSGAMQLPFPASVITGGILTAMMGVTGGIQANNIRKQEYADGGVVGGFNGASMGKDNRNATIRDGEMIFNARQQRNLFKMVDSGDAGGKGISVNIEKFSGGDDELSKLEDMLYRLQSNGRFRFA